MIRDQYPQARLELIYDANKHGWKASNFHECCKKKGWTLTIVETINGYLFGGFTTAELDYQPGRKCIFKPDPAAFLFSVNQNTKYPIKGQNLDAILCSDQNCIMFGAFGKIDMSISSESNTNSSSTCTANTNSSFELPLGNG